MSAALENRRPADVPPRGDEGDPGPTRVLGPTPGEIVALALGEAPELDLAAYDPLRPPAGTVGSAGDAVR